jgi:hypothetical protein
MLYNSTSELSLKTMGLLNHIGQMFGSALIWVQVTILAAIWQRMLVWFNTWVFADWVSLNWFAVILLLDTITGTAMHVKLKTFSAKDLLLKTLINKVFISAVWFVLVHVVAVFSDLNPDDKISAIVEFFRNGVLFTYFVQSITDNVIVLTNGKFPPLYAEWRAKFGKKD